MSWMRMPHMELVFKASGESQRILWQHPNVMDIRATFVEYEPSTHSTVFVVAVNLCAINECYRHYREGGVLHSEAMDILYIIYWADRGLGVVSFVIVLTSKKRPY